MSLGATGGQQTMAGGDLDVLAVMMGKMPVKAVQQHSSSSNTHVCLGSLPNV